MHRPRLLWFSLLGGLVTAQATTVSALPASAGKELRDGDVYMNTELPTKMANGMHLEAAVDVEASPGVVWDVLIDFPARVEDSWVVDSVKIYKESRNGSRLDRYARWRLSIMGIDIVYHTHYKGDRAKGVLEWVLDNSKENDVSNGIGRYEVKALPGRPGVSRLIYSFEASSKRSVGKGIRRRLASKNISKMLTQLRDRAEKAS